MVTRELAVRLLLVGRPPKVSKHIKSLFTQGLLLERAQTVMSGFGLTEPTDARAGSTAIIAMTISRTATQITSTLICLTLATYKLLGSTSVH